MRKIDGPGGRVRALVALLVAGALLALAGPAQAELTLVDFDGRLHGPSGVTWTQAGAHPDATARFEFTSTTSPRDGVTPIPDEQLKDLRVDLPPGLLGDPRAMPACKRADLSTGDFGSCPADTQVGVATLTFTYGAQPGIPVYNLERGPGEVAQFGFNIFAVATILNASVRPSDHGVSIEVSNAAQSLPVIGAETTLWGVPADPIYDGQRGLGGACFDRGQFTGEVAPCRTTQPRRPLLTAPTSCLGPQTTTLRARSWQNLDRWVSGSFVSHDEADTPVGGTGCERLDFGPSIRVSTSSSQAGAPTGLDVDLAFRQNMGPEALSTAHLKDARVVLPEGMTINPSSAHGLQGCSDEQLALDSDAPVACPDGSKIGSVEATTPVLDETLKGGVYVGTQRSDDPESGEMFRIFLNLVNEERGLNIKLAGGVKANAQTGRLEVSFANNPQLPVSTIDVSMKSGPRAPLANPTTCGTKTVTADLSSWAGQGAALSDTFTIACPGTGGLEPGFQAGSVSPAGGAFSPFVARIDRPDGQQFLSGAEMEMPKGLLAKLKGVPLCSSAAADNGGCPAGSRVGSVTVGAGPGSSPYYVQGDMFLTEGYKGAPFGLAAHVHAKAGPFDLGWCGFVRRCMSTRRPRR